ALTRAVDHRGNLRKQRFVEHDLALGWRRDLGRHLHLDAPPRHSLLQHALDPRFERLEGLRQANGRVEEPVVHRLQRDMYRIAFQLPADRGEPRHRTNHVPPPARRPSEIAWRASSTSTVPCMAYRRAYKPPGSPTSSSCVPCSTIRPSSRTRIISACRMVDSRCAITNVVLSRIRLAIASWTSCS